MRLVSIYRHRLTLRIVQMDVEEEMSSRMDELKGNLSAEKGRIARQQIEMKAAEF